MKTLFVCVLASLLPQAAAKPPQVLRVGKNKPFALPSQAAAVAKDGAIVEIDAGVYEKDVASWTAGNLTLRGVGGRAHLKSGGAAAEGKAIWVLSGKNATVENIEFSGCAVSDRNGAGIRLQGDGLTLRNCYFHDNEMGILTSGLPGCNILIEHSEFARNGAGDGQSHNIYIGTVKSFTLRHCYTHHTKIGHNLKTRAQTNYILHNRIMDEESGTSSYAIDVPNGGLTYVIGNLIHKGPNSENSGVLTYAAEGAKNEKQELYVVNNTFVNDRASATFISLRGTPTAVSVINNIFAGPGALLSGKGESSNNLISKDPLFVDRARYDYRLQKGSPAIDAGKPPGKAGGFDLTPRFHYVHPLRKEARPTSGALDLGAVEFSGK
jgi:hypothetical protein